jgi:hypothetical protein
MVEKFIIIIFFLLLDGTNVFIWRPLFHLFYVDNVAAEQKSSLIPRQNKNSAIRAILLFMVTYTSTEHESRKWKKAGSVIMLITSEWDSTACF